MLEEEHNWDKYSDQLGNESNLYIVEAILNKRLTKKNGRQELQYLVRWEGYPRIEDHTWEPASHLSLVQSMIDDFEKSRLKKRTSGKGGHEHQNERQQFHRSESSKQLSREMGGKKKSKTDELNGDDESSAKLKHLKKMQEQTSINLLDDIIPEDYYITKKSVPIKQKLDDKHKEKEKKASKESSLPYPKRANPFLPPQTKQKKLESQKTIQKPQTPLRQYGRIVNHTYRNSEMIYEIEKLNSSGKPITTLLLPSSKIKEQCMTSLNEYLQKYLIELEEYSKPI